MEERLFVIGLVMGVYAWGTRYGSKSGRLDSRWAASAWHGLFCAMAGFAAALVAVMSLESRAKIQPMATGTLSFRELYPCFLGGALFGILGGWRAWIKAKSREAREYYRTEDLEWAETIFSAVLLASFMMYFVVQAFKIPSGSMRSTLLEGDHLFVNKFIYGVRIPFTQRRIFRFRPIERRDIIVFRFPSEDPQDIHCGSSQYGKDFIKRVIGLPGDEIKVVAGKVYVNGAPAGTEPYAQYLDFERNQKFTVPVSLKDYQELWADHKLDHSIGDIMRDQFGPVRVPPGSYFAMGDNRDRSCDSRFWGPVPEHDIKGKAWLIYWPPSRIGRAR